MIARLLARLGSQTRSFARRRDGSVAPLLAISLIPVLGTVAAAIDYSRASAVRTKLQAAMDSAMFAGIRDGSENWQQIAQNMFFANNKISNDVAINNPSFSADGNGTYSARANAVVTNMFGILGIKSITVSVRTDAAAGAPEASCLLLLDQGKPLTNVSVSFNGAPNIQLTGCSMRSNTSIDCTGHGTGAGASIAAGNVNRCSNPQPYSSVVPDIYAALASNIVPLCGAQRANTTWIAGVLPVGAKTVNQNGYTEYHICGDVTLSGSGQLIGGSAPASDSVIIIENGSLTLANDASINTARTTIILTGNNAYPSTIHFPNGVGKLATLALSPSMSSDNPWQGVALYQNPILTNGVDHDWNSGATFKADGVIYLPRSNLSLSGRAVSNTYNCSKVVANTIAASGSVSINFSQVKSGCSTIGMKQAPAAMHLI